MYSVYHCNARQLPPASLSLSFLLLLYYFRNHYCHSCYSARTKQPSGCVICTELYYWPQHLPSHDLRPFQLALACPAAAQPTSTHSTTTVLLLLCCSVPLPALSAAWLLFQCCCSIIPPSKTTIHPVFPVHHKYSEPSPYKTADFVRTAQSAV